MSTKPVFTTWNKSTLSGGGDDCVEVSFAADGSVGVRDSNDTGGAVLVFTESEWAAFVVGVTAGELHGPTTA